MILFTGATTATAAGLFTATSSVTSRVVVAHAAATDADVRQVDDVDAEFFALIYSDPELLRDEFEELVAAAWSGRPPPRGTPGPAVGHLSARKLPARSTAEADRPDWSEAPEIAVVGLDRPRRSGPDRGYPTGDNRTKNADPGYPYSAGGSPVTVRSLERLTR